MHTYTCTYTKVPATRWDTSKRAEAAGWNH